MKLALDLGDHLIGTALQIGKPVARRFQAARRFVQLETQGARRGSPNG
jgi:hypothetical protein